MLNLYLIFVRHGKDEENTLYPALSQLTLEGIAQSKKVKSFLLPFNSTENNPEIIKILSME